MGGYLNQGAICQEALHYNSRMCRDIMVQKVSTAFQHWGLTLQTHFNNLIEDWLFKPTSIIYHQHREFTVCHFPCQHTVGWSTKVIFNFCKQTFLCFSDNVVLCSMLWYKGCLGSFQPFWISWELVAWPWCNLAARQRRPYCASVNSHSPVGLVSRQWDPVDWALVLCDYRIYKPPPFQWRF